ncbi:hypothetical protein C807_01003, partial [Lachnospiraceae bacterium 28-4]
MYAVSNPQNAGKERREKEVFINLGI